MSDKRKKGLVNIFVLTVNDEQRSEEIAEREINHTLAIRFLNLIF